MSLRGGWAGWIPWCAAALIAHAGARVRTAQAESVLAAHTESPPAARAVTLAEARTLARTRHPSLASLRARVEAAAAEARVPSAQWLPQVGAMAQLMAATTNNSTTTLLNTNTVDLPRIGGTQIGEDPSLVPSPSSAVAIGVRQQLFDFGRVEAEAAAARLLRDAARHRADEAELDIDAAVVQAFYAVLSARAVYEASLEAERRAQAHRDMASTAVKTGLRPKIDLARVEADLTRFELGVLTAAGSLRVARTVLAAACNAEENELDARGESPDLGPLPSFSELLDAAPARDPAILAAEAETQAQRAAATALVAQLRPRLFATAALSGRAGGAQPNTGSVPPGDGYLPVVPNWHVGAVLSWPLYDPSITRRKEAAELREREAAENASAVRRARRAALGAAYQEASMAAQAVAITERAAQAARENYEHAQQRFQVGLGTVIELADAQAVRTAAEIQFAIAKYQAAQKRALLARAAAEKP